MAGCTWARTEPRAGRCCGSIGAVSSATNPPTDIEQAIALFRQQFAQTLPQRMAEARACLEAALAAPQDDAPLRELHRVLHKLAGSAGTFGMPEFGLACRAVEDRLEALLARAQRTRADLEAVERALADLAPPA